VTEYFSAGQLLGKTFALLRRGALRAAAALVAMAGLGVLADSGAVAQANVSALNLVGSGLSVAAAYWITKALLEDIGGRQLPARFPAFFGLGFLSGLGILLGAVVLILPGIFLFIRWSASSPMLLGGEGGVTEAMQASWRATGPHFSAILVAFLALYAPSWGLGLAAHALGGVASGNLIAIIVANVALNAGLIAGWHAAVAIYNFLEAPDRLAETFA
jgi:hypothetical protein